MNEAFTSLIFNFEWIMQSVMQINELLILEETGYQYKQLTGSVVRCSLDIYIMLIRLSCLKANADRTYTKSFMITN